MIFGLGRTDNHPNVQIPFFLDEIRRRLVTGSYTLDKTLAMTLSRPPLIGRRYFDVQLPLDLSYDEVLADPDIRDAAISKLDSSGWNSEGSDQKAGWLRVSALVGSIREQILELSLGRHVDDAPKKAMLVLHLLSLF